MDIKIKIQRRYLSAFLYTSLSVAYYTIQGSSINSSSTGVLLLVALGGGLLDIVTHIDMGLRRMFILLISAFFIGIRFLDDLNSRLIIAFIALIIGGHVKREPLLKCIFYSKLFTYFIVHLVGGYINPNTNAINGGILIMLYIMLYYNRDKYNDKRFVYIIAFFAYFILFFWTKSEALLVGCGLFLIGVWGLKSRFVKGILEWNGLVLFFPIVVLFTWAISCLGAYYFYNDSEYNFFVRMIPELSNVNIVNILQRIDIFLTGRLRLSAYSLSIFGIDFWGGTLNYEKQLDIPYFIVDSGIILLLQKWGVGIAIILSVLFIILMKYLIQNKDYKLVLFTIVITLWAVVEDVFFAIGTNFLYFVIGESLVRLWYKKKKNISIATKNIM